MVVDTKPTTLRVPVLDVGALMSCENDTEIADALRDDNPDMKNVLGNIRAASTEWGFFYISNHGVNPEQMQRFQTVMRAFFALPDEVKNSLRVNPSNARGYNEKELTKQKLDWKQVFDMGGPRDNDAPVGGRRNQWPSEDELPGFRETMTEYFSTMGYLSRRLIQVIAVALGEQPEKVMGVYQHTDIGALTVLLQDDEVASLQVFHRESQQWVLVPPIKDTFVINLGDLVQVWSNDKFVAPLHRVVGNRKARYSAPFFYFPTVTATIKPIVVNDGANGKPHYEPFNWLEFLRLRFQGNLEDLGEEVQISHYRVKELP